MGRIMKKAKFRLGAVGIVYMILAESVLGDYRNISVWVYFLFCHAIVDITVSKDDPYALSDWAAILILLGLVFIVDSFEPGHWVVIPFVILIMAVLVWLIWYRRRDLPKE